VSRFEHSRKNGDITEPRTGVHNRKHDLEGKKIPGSSPAIEDVVKITAIEPVGFQSLGPGFELLAVHKFCEVTASFALGMAKSG
jgi:hypothetical protein